jgi:hypothetical protein
MKIMDINEDKFWGDKVNFIDANNVLIGYDMSQCCCEDASWYLSDSVEDYSNDAEEIIVLHLDDYCFDPSFFEERNNSKTLDRGAQVIFKLIAEGRPDLYLNLYNAHNGYYGHGFTVTHGGQLMQEGVL